MKCHILMNEMSDTWFSSLPRDSPKLPSSPQMWFDDHTCRNVIAFSTSLLDCLTLAMDTSLFNLFIQFYRDKRGCTFWKDRWSSEWDVFNHSTQNCLGTATDGWQLKDGTFARVQFCSLPKVIDRARGIRRSSNKCHPSWQLRDNPFTAIYLNLSVMLLAFEYFFTAEYRNSRFLGKYMHFCMWSLYASQFLAVRITNIKFAFTANHDNFICIFYSFYIVSHLSVSHLYLERRRLKLVRSVENIFFLWQSENMHWLVKEPRLLKVGLDFHR